MDKTLIERINELARRQKAQGLNEDELLEQAALRAEYIREIRAGIEAQLEMVYIENEEGEYEKLQKKE
ncbi:MAG: DUF896 domain-containing protein [Clostridiales bacterium]|nr:DUF896 domain-containing protein [Clostridiales bacterium]